MTVNETTYIERVFDRIVSLRPEMPDRVILARLATAAMFLPVVIPIRYWRTLTWKNSRLS